MQWDNKVNSKSILVPPRFFPGLPVLFHYLNYIGRFFLFVCAFVTEIPEYSVSLIGYYLLKMQKNLPQGKIYLIFLIFLF